MHLFDLAKRWNDRLISKVIHGLVEALLRVTLFVRLSGLSEKSNRRESFVFEVIRLAVARVVGD